MSQKDLAAWTRASFDFWMLGAEAASVMSLRMIRLATGGSAGAKEAELMLAEKVQAAVELQTRFMTGAVGMTPLGVTQGVLKHYRKKVAANSRRLMNDRHR